MIQKRMELPTLTSHYYLLSKESARIHYGVDHSCVLLASSSSRPSLTLTPLLMISSNSTYMSTVAKDMGAAPGLLHLWWEHGWFILLVYCFSAGSCTPLLVCAPGRTLADLPAPRLHPVPQPSRPTIASSDRSPLLSLLRSSASRFGTRSPAEDCSATCSWASSRWPSTPGST